MKSDLLEMTGFYELGRRWCNFNAETQTWQSSDTNKKARDTINTMAHRIADREGTETTPEIFYYATAGYYFNAYHTLKKKPKKKGKKK